MTYVLNRNGREKLRANGYMLEVCDDAEYAANGGNWHHCSLRDSGLTREHFAEVKDPELKPCPFCGGRGYFAGMTGGAIAHVRCHSCGARAADATPKSAALEIWNRRT